MVTFCATEELGWSFISASGLHLPHVDQHVSAFGALHPHSGHGVNIVFFAYYGNLLVQGVLYYFAAGLRFNFFFSVRLHVTTLGASKGHAGFRPLRYKTGAATRTKLHDKLQLRICKPIKNKIWNIKVFLKTHQRRFAPLKLTYTLATLKYLPWIKKWITSDNPCQTNP